MIGHALLVVDVQNDFCPGGALAVDKGDEILPAINRLIDESEHVILTQDWHPAGHSSFATSHPGKKPFDTIHMPYGPQTLWPDHCVQGTHGADFHPDLQWTRAQMLIRKGFRIGVDSYSALFENDHQTPTGLAGYLRERNIGSLTLAGLATDFCVAFSALDAVSHGFQVRVRLDACRGIDIGGSMNTMLEKMQKAGVELINEPALASHLL
ncbi:nicotinamidase/pyrazinamidase [Ochrobactrum sp. MYb15]|uniref:bifunctional nicotinamidase/pyrazinamidase n=1 Tax=Brucella pituitosa TaxID=571256 RepID=UPI000CFC32E0|nr:nicotinamidase/pyrazinamidase [Ochrobactrum sp. MYb19]PRA56165.1 nicotinamidase/pyrazinamidase [Ochrobactrum sp. MYb68]PRA65468.1 nicotinamidase/pyrazinamidase [Ochrobactrum sp. MYb18]PRA77158.1 nicotinamidase/pyrazinamidase [Brucella thiophenivorans]PRA93208.1 nicotinamidase/pyrazinamidase [Ochrobactrum sp. MYb14]PRA99167.1 nicotinamidase/pyrazinamidase [Ochrobactrum sp. MYb15]